jgi:hypothetical protein
LTQIRAASKFENEFALQFIATTMRSIAYRSDQPQSQAYFVATSQDVSGMPWMSYPRHWTGHGRTLSGINKANWGLSHCLFQYARCSRLPPSLSVSRNAPSFLHLIARQDRSQNFTRVGAWEIQQTRCCQHVAVRLLLFIRLFSNHAIPSLLYERFLDVFPTCRSECDHCSPLPYLHFTCPYHCRASLSRHSATPG